MVMVPGGGDGSGEGGRLPAQMLTPATTSRASSDFVLMQVSPNRALTPPSASPDHVLTSSLSVSGGVSGRRGLQQEGAIRRGRLRPAHAPHGLSVVPATGAASAAARSSSHPPHAALSALCIDHAARAARYTPNTAEGLCMTSPFDRPCTAVSIGCTLVVAPD